MKEAHWQTLRINEDRFKGDFEELSRIGATPDGGVDRPALSTVHLEARAWLQGKIEAAGLGFKVDGAGNQHAILTCGPPGAPSLVLGSHLDSVPDGGRFDGALGVLAALEALRCVKEAGLCLPVNLEAIDFTDEEGTLVSFLGSYAWCGKLQKEELLNPRSDPQTFETSLKRAGLTHETILAARRDPASLAGYLELHIEQGLKLWDSGTAIGVVSSIAGMRP